MMGWTCDWGGGRQGIFTEIGHHNSGIYRFVIGNTNFPGQSLSKTLEEAMDLSQDRLLLELE
jgi:hypothetical protein